MTTVKHPRINCSVNGCNRGSTVFEPGTRMICGKCWRRAPKETRERYSFWRRHARRFEKKGNPRAEQCNRRCNAFWETILNILNDTEPKSVGLTAIMAEELRKAGLL